MENPIARLRRARLERKLGARFSPTTFALVLIFYQRDPAYSLGLASISAFAKREIDDLRVHLVPIFEGDSTRKIARLVKERRPDLVAVSAMSPTWLPLDPYLRVLRRCLPETPILVGGYQAIVSPEETIGHPAVDYVCVGEGELPLVGLIRRLRGSSGAVAPIPGVWEKTPSGHIVKASPALMNDLTSLPLPDYTIFEREGDLGYLSPRAIQSKTLITLPVISGRGCPYRCSYCANTTLLDLYRPQGSLLRKYDPEALVEELLRLRERYRVQYFQFWDEEFLYDMRYSRRLLDLYRREVALPFSLFARIENMDDDLCRLAASAGCHSIWFGIESGSEDYRRRYLNRRMTNQRIADAAETARKHRIKRMAFSMVGMPFETRDNLRETLELNRAIRPELVIFSQFLPLPGTPLYQLCKEHDLLLEPSVERQMWPLGELNIKQHAGGMKVEEMKQAAGEIMQYLADHSRFDA